MEYFGIAGAWKDLSTTLRDEPSIQALVIFLISILILFLVHFFLKKR